MKRDYHVPTDRLGPTAAPRLRLSRKGHGAQLVLVRNPVSFLVNPLECLPFLSDRGERSLASQWAFGGAGSQGEVPEGGNTSGTPLSVSDGAQGAPVGTRSDLSGGNPFALWGSRKNLGGVQTVADNRRITAGAAPLSFVESPSPGATSRTDVRTSFLVRRVKG